MFFLSEISFGQVTLIPDPGFEQLLINKEYDTVLDGQVLTANISNVYALYIDDIQITDLTGIQDFTNLQILFFYDNSVTSLDVSNLQLLRILNCAKNNITSLNLSGMASLTSLVIGENPLTSVNLSNLPSLNDLHASSTPLLTSLVIDTSSLTYIDLSRSGLTALDVSHLPLLESLTVDENNLTQLNVTGLSALKLLNAYKNNLTELDLTGTNLNELYCSHNQLTSLSLKNQTALTTFGVSNNPYLYCIEVYDVAHFNSFPWWYKDSHATYKLDCNAIYLPDDNFEQALIALGYDDVMDDTVQRSVITGITSLDISGKNISDLTGIEFFTNLTELNCSDNPINGSMLQNMTKLTKLNCSNTGNYSFNFANLNLLEWLDCSQNNLADLDLQNNNNLNYLDCSNNGISNVAFTFDNPLEYMYCSNNSLFRIETFHLTKLKKLICNNNVIYDMDIRDLNDIVVLDISDNQISNMWLKPLPLLQSFKCANNSITKLQLFDFTSLTQLECQNNNLTFLNLKGTAISSLDCTSNSLSCISMNNPEITIGNPNFLKDENATFEESCQIGPFTLIPDIKFEQLLLNEGYDEVLDGKIPTNVAAGISNLSLYNMGISDLTGINAFTSLYSLDLQGNYLTNLDALIGMSWITSLYCSENEFVNLDFDGLGLTSVETFYCTDSALETINFGDGMPNLVELYLYENNLTALDLSMLQNLYMVECNNNQLTSLNIAGLQNLGEVDCSNNMLTDIDLSGIIYLGRIDCNENQITSLDFTETPEIYEIECRYNKISSLNISGLTNLYNLDCSYNELTQLDLSSAENLENLYCNNNQITSLSPISNYMSELECGENKLTTLDLSNVGEIQWLTCHENQLVSLTLNPSLGFLGCENNFLTSLDLSNSTNLYGLLIDSNYISSIDLTNLNLYYFSAVDNKYLKCIKVDDVEQAQSEWSWQIDGDAYYATVCNSCATATMWNETEWVPAAPDNNSIAFIKGTLNVTTDLEFCSLVLLEDAQLNVASENNIHVVGTLDIAETASLVLENNSNLIQSGNLDENRGIITVKRNEEMRRLDYVYWSSPVADQNLFAFSDKTLSNRFYSLDEPTNSFVAFANPANESFIAAKGFMVRAPNTFPANGNLATFNGLFNGRPHTGNISIDVTNSDASKGFNMIGNPYPSTIDADAFMDANPDIDVLYFWTHATQDPTASNYATYNASGAAEAATTSPGNEPNGTIQVGQGFLAKMAADAPQQAAVSFKNDMRIGNNENQFFRSATSIEKNRIWLNLSDSTKKLNQILTGYITNATNAIDSRYDGKLIETTGSKLYNIIENSEYVIQAKALPFTADDVVKLGFKTETGGNFIISIDHVDGLFAGDQSIFLKDNLTGIIHDLKQENYDFASAQGEFKDRFEIVYQAALGIKNPELSADTIILFKENGILNVNSQNLVMLEIQLFDLRGRLVYEKSAINLNVIKLHDLKAANQVLLAKITTTDNKTITKKVVY